MSSPAVRTWRATTWLVVCTLLLLVLLWTPGRDQGLSLVGSVSASSASSPLILDYTLYSQLLNEVRNDDDDDDEGDMNSENTVQEEEDDDDSDDSDDDDDDDDVDEDETRMGESQRVLKYFEDNKRLIAKYNHYLFFPERERVRLKELAKSMFEFGYNNYIAHAWPFDGSLIYFCTIH